MIAMILDEIIKTGAAPVTVASPLATEAVAAAAKAPVLTPFQAGLEIFNNYMGVLLVGFMATLLATPLCRRFAIANGIIDRPDEVRKHHKFPIAYLGGVAVYIGILAAIAFSYFGSNMGLLTPMTTKLNGGELKAVPLSFLFGFTLVMLVGLFDDVSNITPLQKVGGLLIAAAMLAYDNIGTNLAAQVLSPIGDALFNNPEMRFVIFKQISMWGEPPHDITFDAVYWSGVILIALVVLGACNASNLVDGLDGLLSGVTAISGIGLLIIALGLAQQDNGEWDQTRIVLCLALIGACLGFLPHNFNPATIFLGDTGSLLLGFVTATIILSLGSTGRTNLVLAGLIVYSVPIIDTALAIIRRKMAGKKISEGDDQHLHHMLKRAVGVKGAALVLYAIALGFAILGVLLVDGKARWVYALVIFLASYIAVIAIKQARRKQFEEQAKKLAEMTGKPGSSSANPQPSASDVAAAGKAAVLAEAPVKA
jgi:UDP-GlcNAc:undecaprenyl-phosphate/decaprenyl-phosphate GlcNAc-1-phosphate transferase